MGLPSEKKGVTEGKAGCSKIISLIALVIYIYQKIIDSCHTVVFSESFQTASHNHEKSYFLKK